MGQPGIANYNVAVTLLGVDLEDPDTLTSNATRLNVTGLLPNMDYEFSVQAVAAALDVENPSALSIPEPATTSTTG
jgi:hypothetical protein